MSKKAELILEYKKNGRILDVGCGDGSLLKFLKESGWQVFGVEPHETSSRYAQEVLGLNVFPGRLDEANYPEESFDVITLFHVLEHLPDPAETLEKSRPLLRKDGFLLVEVPNFESFETKIFRSKWVGLSAPLHLYHFTPGTLQMILKNCGFFLVELGFVPEHTKYVSGYSESLRNCLMDVGLYPSRSKRKESKKEEFVDRRNSTDSSWLNQVHFLEYKIFKFVSDFMDKIGLGSNLLAIARKEI